MLKSLAGFSRDIQTVHTSSPFSATIASTSILSMTTCPVIGDNMHFPSKGLALLRHRVHCLSGPQHVPFDVWLNISWFIHQLRLAPSRDHNPHFSPPFIQARYPFQQSCNESMASTGKPLIFVLHCSNFWSSSWCWKSNIMGVFILSCLLSMYSKIIYMKKWDRTLHLFSTISMDTTK